MGNCCKGSHKIGGGGGSGSAKKYRKEHERKTVPGMLEVSGEPDEIGTRRRRLYYTDGLHDYNQHTTRSDRPISKFNGDLAATNKQFLLHQSNFIANNNSQSNNNYNSVSFSKLSHPLINNKLGNKKEPSERPSYNQTSSANDFSSTNLTSSTHSTSAVLPNSTLNEFTSENQSQISSLSQISRDFELKKKHKSKGSLEEIEIAKKLIKVTEQNTIDEESNLTSSIIDLSKKNQVSLSNSKRNIESIERTIKDSKSIEIWLDQISVEESASTRKLSKKVPLVYENQKDHELKIDIKPPLKLADQCKEAADFVYNSIESVEADLNESISESFIYPNASDDKVFLKWLIGDHNYSVALLQPNVNKSARRFVMTPANLNISLEVEDISTSSSSSLSSDKNLLADQTYLTYSSASKHLLINVSKIDSVISQEKQLVDHQPLNNSMNKERLDEFRSSYTQTPNFIGVQCLMSMMKKKSSPMLLNSSSSSTTTSTTSSDMFHKVSYSDLEEKLFASFLCKYSCQLSDTFLASKDSIESFGIIRRGGDHQSAVNQNIFSFLLLEKGLKDELCASSTSLSFGFRLNKWPGEYSLFFQRMRKGQLVSNSLLSQLELNTCLITPADSNQDDAWLVDTSLAETVLFRSLNKTQIFKFYFYLTLINSLDKLLPSSKLNESIHVDQRVLLHHFFRFLESTSTLQENPVTKSKGSSKSLITKDVLLKFCINFNAFIRSNLAKHKTLNKPNFFLLESSILISAPENYTNCKLIEQAFSKQFDSFLRAGSMFELSSLSMSLNKQNSLLNEYIQDFYTVLFGQFKLKQDNFKLKEDMLWEIHDKLVTENSSFKEAFDTTDTRQLKDGLSRELEYYAEFVHKYLPKVRQHNQYLLFHYVWTMQVQYLAPFFNYISELCKRERRHD